MNDVSKKQVIVKFNDNDFPDLITATTAITRSTKLNYANAAAQKEKLEEVATLENAAAQKEKLEEVATLENATDKIQPGWVCLSYSNNNIIITKSTSKEQAIMEELDSTQKIQEEKERIDHIFDKMLDTWESQKDYFFEMNGLDEYNKVYSNASPIDVSDQYSDEEIDDYFDY